MVVAFYCTVLLALAAQENLAQQNASLHIEVLRAVDEQPLADGAPIFKSELLYVDLTLGFEQSFLDQQMLNLWRKPLDLQVELGTPWAEKSDQWLATPSEAVGETSLVIDRAKGFVKRLPDSKNGWACFHLRRELLVTHSGLLQLPAAWMRLAWATRFEDDLVRGTVPLDREEFTIISNTWQTSVALPPEQNAPAGFLGAVGRFTLNYEEKTLSTSVAAADGEIREVRIALRGVGFLDTKMLPSLQLPSGVHLRGQRVEVLPDGLALVAELQFNNSNAELPALHWSFFDPSNPAHYVSLQTPGASPAEQSTSTSKLPWIVGGGLLFIIIMLYFQRRRGAAMVTINAELLSAPTVLSASAPARAPARAPASARASAPARAPACVPAQKPRDFIDHLASHLHCRREEIYAADLSNRLLQSGLAPELAAEINTAVQALIQARYAEQGDAPSMQQLTELTQRLQIRST